jgi:hypothetical protein
MYADYDSEEEVVLIGDGEQEISMRLSEAEDLIDRLNEILLEHPEE